MINRLLFKLINLCNCSFFLFSVNVTLLLISLIFCCAAFSIDSIACCLTTDNSFSTTFTGTLTITFDPSSNVTSTFAVKLSEIVAVDGVSITSAES